MTLKIFKPKAYNRKVKYELGIPTADSNPSHLTCAAVRSDETVNG
tara:strand:- start:126 stop:260 length:135 start_codon:yes stop_codon:yes gene_type:complete